MLLLALLGFALTTTQAEAATITTIDKHHSEKASSMKLTSLTLAGVLLASTAYADTTPASPPSQNGDSNQAVVTTTANASQPAKGANSFTEGEARHRIEKDGFSNVADLMKDGDGIWRGHGTKNNATVSVWLDYKGNIGQQ